MVADIIVIAIVAIVALIGFGKGFVKSIWGIITLAAVGVSLFFLSPLLGGVLANDLKLADKLEPPFTKMAANLIPDSANITFDSSYTAESAIAKMEENQITKIVSSMLKGNMEELLPESGQTVTLREMLGYQIATYILTFAAGIIITIVVCIVMALLKKIPMKLANFKVMKLTDRLLGLCFTSAVCIAILLAVGGIAGTLRGQSFMSSINKMSDDSKVFQYVYGEDNPLQKIFDEKLNLGKYFSD